MKAPEKTETALQRKTEHLRIVLEEEVQHRGSTLLEDVQLVHQALPELNLDQIRLETEFFGRRLTCPLMITSMTGGAEHSEKMNHGLAEVAEKAGIAFSVGSQRVMLRHPEVTPHFAVRKQIPNGVLLGNIGAVQLDEYPLEVITRLVEKIEADGLCVHLNAAQELMQAEGHRNFQGIADRLAELVDRLEGKVLVKETGAGMSPKDLRKLSEIGVPYIDVAGAGGTSWTKVEKHRAQDPVLRRLGETFGDWGVPTAFSVLAAGKFCSRKTRVIASGGIANGLDAARAMALGADLVGFARPALLAFLQSGVAGGVAFVEQIRHELKVAMLLTGVQDTPALRTVPRVYTGRLREWLSAYGWTEEMNSKHEKR